MKRAPRADLARDLSVVEKLVGVRPLAACVVKETDRRLVVRYDVDGSDGIFGKWFATDRGAVVADALEGLRAGGVAVPRVVAYAPDERALFVEAVRGPLLRDALRDDPDAAVAAGAWLAGFHASPFTSPRSCGPAKQIAAVARWAHDVDALRPIADRLAAALDAAPDPERPVHYDYYHSQVLLPPDGPVVLDLDEAGLGDPAFDVAHFEAHLRLLALQWHGDADAFAPAQAAFRRGYGDAIAEPDPALVAFAWFKLAYQLYRRDADPRERDYALAAVSRTLAAA